MASRVKLAGLHSLCEPVSARRLRRLTTTSAVSLNNSGPLQLLQLHQSQRAIRFPQKDVAVFNPSQTATTGICCFFSSISLISGEKLSVADDSRCFFRPNITAFPALAGSRSIFTRDAPTAPGSTRFCVIHLNKAAILADSLLKCAHIQY